MKHKSRLFSPFSIVMIVALFICLGVNATITGDWTVLPMVAAVAGVLNVTLSAQGSLWNYIFGVLTVTLYAIVAFGAGNYGDAVMNAFYLLPMQFVGFWQWKKHGAGLDTSSGRGGAPVQARRLSWKMRGVTLAAMAVAIVIIAFILGKVNATAPWVDATKTVLNIVAQLLMSLAFMEQFILWIAVNVSSVTLWIISAFQDKPGAIVMIIMWTFYLIISIYGLKVWLGLSKK